MPIAFEPLSAQIAAYARALDLRRDDHFVSWLPLYHDMGLIACLVLPFLARLPVTVFSAIEWVMDPRPFLRSIGHDRATLAWLPNFAFSFMAKRPPEPQMDLSSLRRVISCSEPVRAESLEAFRDRFAPAGLRPESLHTSYAMAEATFAVTQSTEREPPRWIRASVEDLGRRRIVLASSGEPDKRLVSCGVPIDGMTIRVVDEAGADCAEGDLGEIWLRGDSVMEDYLDGGPAGAPRAAFSEGWYRTGDLGGVRDGHLFVTGRKKDMLIVGGVNLYPEDIEASVGELAAVHAGRVVALGLADESTGTERLVVVAETADTVAPAERARVEADVRTTVLAITGLAPAHVFVVPPKWIVKSTAGKISRVETRARVLERWDELTARGPLGPG